MNITRRIMSSNKLKPINLYSAAITAISPQKKILKWSSSKETKNNFGDALNPWLFRKMTHYHPVNANNIFNFLNRNVYSVIGSILDNNTKSNLVVWGSGFKEKDSKLIKKPIKVCAVRGPLSRKKLLEMGVDCPPVYGDPALLLPVFYNPIIKKEYKLGIIAHYADKNTDNYKKFINKLPADVLIINIENQIESVINDILKCDKIASSSLHGLIVADAYNIPSLYIKFSNNIVGGNFKFKDYMASVEREFIEPMAIYSETTSEYVMNSFTNYSISFSSEDLLATCPFI